MKTLKSQAGAAIVEFALVVSLLMVLLVGLIDFGLIWLQSHYIANAAREGARIAAKTGVTSAAEPDFAQVETAIEDYLIQFYGALDNPDYTGAPPFVVSDMEMIDDLDGSGLTAARVSVTVQFTRFYDPPIWGLLNAGLPFFPPPASRSLLSMTEEAIFPHDDQSAP